MSLAMEIPYVLDTSAAPRLVRERKRILLVSACLLEGDKLEAVLERFPSYAILSACPEKHHVNLIGFKLFGILARIPVDELSVLTTDGSMHCVQLHYLAEELGRVFSFRRRHFVYEKGEILEVEPEAVKISRYLSRVSKMLARLSSHEREH